MHDLCSMLLQCEFVFRVYWDSVYAWQHARHTDLCRSGVGCVQQCQSSCRMSISNDDEASPPAMARYGNPPGLELKHKDNYKIFQAPQHC